MDNAKPGHTVEFQGLKGAKHLNGTKGTLVNWVKKEQRWCVRCDVNNEKVCAKPENLVLHRNAPAQHTPPSGGSPWNGSTSRGGGVQRTSGGSPWSSGPQRTPPTVAGSLLGGGGDASAWAKGLSQKDQYEWFANCYQMRCDDDYVLGGCNLHGPYDPEKTPDSLLDDFLVYCSLAHRAKAVPSGWDWPAFLKVAAEYIVFAFEKSDAKERWGSENVFVAQMGGRSLRYTGIQIYKSLVDNEEESREHRVAKEEVKSDPEKLQKKVGGVKAWETLLHDLEQSGRF